MSDRYNWPEDYDDDEYCPECGDRMEWVECYVCWGEGGFDADDLMDEDPLWYDGVDWEDCRNCNGRGGWYACFIEHRVKHE